MGSSIMLISVITILGDNVETKVITILDIVL